MIKFEKSRLAINPIKDDCLVVGRIVDVKITGGIYLGFAITIEILNGKHIGMLVRDERFHQSENGNYYWKFQQLMKAIGFNRYDEYTDIERCLLNQYVCLGLSIYVTENRKGQRLEFQNVKYSKCLCSKGRLEELKKQTENLINEKYTRDNEDYHGGIPFDDSENPFV